MVLDTIFALSSGALPSGVAVVRFSGGGSRFAFETMAGGLTSPRQACLRGIRRPGDGEILDRAIVLWFPAPASFTGEDCGEFHIHGGRAVVEAVLAAMAELPSFRMAEPGEFARRAFMNGKLDLTELEGLADLMASETEAQRRQAFAQADGALRRKLEAWRAEIVRLRANVEAGFDFADEDDVPGDVSGSVLADALRLADSISLFLADGNRGEIIRSGFQVVLMGEPNSGKSSLLNALAQRDVSIVSGEPGTTRDLIEVSLDLGGYRLVLVDTAGIREVPDGVEGEGIRRALGRAERADLVIWLHPVDAEMAADFPETGAPIVVVRSKDDSGAFRSGSVSVLRSGGVDWLISELAARAAGGSTAAQTGIVTRGRHRSALRRCEDLLREAAGPVPLPFEVRAELLRRAGDEIGRLTGRIDVEDLLERIFSEFCIGK